VNTQELLQKTIDTTALAAGGLLGTEQFNRFVDLVVDQSVMLKQARVVRMRSAVTELDKIATAGRVSQLKSEGIAPDTLATAAFGKVTLTATDIITPFEITFEALEDSIEGPNLEDTVIRVMAKQTATDLEELAICGDTESADAYLQGLDGWRVLAEDAEVVDLEGATLDKAGLGAMFRALPDRYKRAYGDLRFFCAPTVAQDWHDTFADRGTAAGDDALVSGQVPPYMGVPVVAVPQIPTDCDGVGEYVGTDLSYCFLTPRENLVFGIHREIRIDKDRDVLRGVNIYAITSRIAVAFEDADAVVLAVNVGTGVE
jgi:HK97 family phage major capsid protein